jgi:hypothetical protein
MAKKKADDFPAVRAIAAESEERRRTRLEEEIAREQDVINKAYDRAMETAWRKYSSAMRDNTDSHKPGTEMPYDVQYDRDRAAALKEWKDASKQLEHKADSIGV